MPNTTNVNIEFCLYGAESSGEAKEGLENSEFGKLIVIPNSNGSWRIDFHVKFDKLPHRTESEELNAYHDFTIPKRAVKEIIKNLISKNDNIVGFVTTVQPKSPELRAFLRCVGFSNSGTRHTKAGTIHYFELNVQKWLESERKKQLDKKIDKV